MTHGCHTHIYVYIPYRFLPSRLHLSFRSTKERHEGEERRWLEMVHLIKLDLDRTEAAQGYKGLTTMVRGVSRVRSRGTG